MGSGEMETDKSDKHANCFHCSQNCWGIKPRRKGIRREVLEQSPYLEFPELVCILLGFLWDACTRWAWIIIHPLSAFIRFFTIGPAAYLVLCVPIAANRLQHWWYRPPSWLSIEESACQAGNVGSIPESGKSPGEGNGSPLPAWQIHGIAKKSELT